MNYLKFSHNLGKGKSTISFHSCTPRPHTKCNIAQRCWYCFKTHMWNASRKIKLPLFSYFSIWYNKTIAVLILTSIAVVSKPVNCFIPFASSHPSSLALLHDIVMCPCLLQNIYQYWHFNAEICNKTFTGKFFIVHLFCFSLRVLHCAHTYEYTGGTNFYLPILLFFFVFCENTFSRYSQ